MKLPALEIRPERLQQKQNDALDQRSFDEKILRSLERGESELPQAAQQRLDALDAGLVDAMDLYPVAQSEYFQQYQDESRSLRRMARRKVVPQIPYDERVQSKLGANY